VTIGETYGSSQRGGAVMSHIRISSKKQRSPLIPVGKADVVVGLEPVEAIRVLIPFGNPDVISLINTRPFYPVDVNAGEAAYPDMEVVKKTIEDLSREVHYIDATEKALQMGSPILGNMIMVGLLLELNLLPFSLEDFHEVLLQTFGKDKMTLNIQALEEGRKAAHK
jgi:indolepyruvate ferredoxin oxidoreductase beta subunit